MELHVLIEGVLFYQATPQKKSTLQKLFAADEEAFHSALDMLRLRLQAGALRLLETDTEVQLVTAPELGEFIDTLRKADLSQDISKAGAETLAIVLYREPVTRGEIDRIRGVNSAFILRNLMTRGLIEREVVKNSHQFRISPALLQHLGVTHKHELPQFGDFMTAIDSFSTTSETV